MPRNRQGGDNETFKIAQPWSLEKGVASFPSPLLTTPAGHAGDELFAVLESLSLAFVAVGERNDLTPLRAYIVLRDMGSMLVDERILAYESANPLIKSWILNGAITAEFEGKSKSESVLRAGLVCKMNEKLVAVSTSDHDPETRKQVLLDLLNEVISSYSKDGIGYWHKATLNKAALNNPPFWPGIRNTSEAPDLVLRSLQSLISGIERLETKIATGV